MVEDLYLHRTSKSLMQHSRRAQASHPLLELSLVSSVSGISIRTDSLAFILCRKSVDCMITVPRVQTSWMFQRALVLS